jgi:uncharacterized coiled-coil protein SlyX
MAQTDAKIKYLEHELDQQEKLIKMMETSGTGVSEDRIASLEKKVRDMEALVKGLTQELLDLKSIAMKMSKQTEERSRQQLVRGPIVQGGAAPAQGAPARGQELYRCIRGIWAQQEGDLRQGQTERPDLRC